MVAATSAYRELVATAAAQNCGGCVCPSAARWEAKGKFSDSRHMNVISLEGYYSAYHTGWLWIKVIIRRNTRRQETRCTEGLELTSSQENTKITTSEEPLAKKTWNYQKRYSTLKEKKKLWGGEFWAPHQAPQPGDLALGRGATRAFGFEGQQALSAGAPQDWVRKRLLLESAQKVSHTLGPRAKQWL